jgi:tetratricopeptide (TPR) repeat protein
MKIFLGDGQGALDAVNRAVALNPSDVEQLIKRAIVYRQLGLYEDAARDLALAVEKAGGVHPAAQHQFCLTLNEMGVELVRDGQPSEAVVYFDKAILGDPAIPELYINRGDAYRLQGQLDLARADYHSALELRPDDADAQLKLSAVHAEIARRLFNETEYDQAIYEVGLAISACPLIPSYHVLRAECRLLANGHDAAIMDLVRAVELRPEPGTVALGKLRLLCPNGLPARVTAALERAEASAHRPVPPRVSRQQDETRRERRTLEAFRGIKSRGDRQVNELFDLRPDFSRDEKHQTTVSLVLSGNQ